KVSAPPSRSLVSRTATTSGRFTATSTQSPPLPPLRVLLCQWAPVRSTIALLDDRADEIVRLGLAQRSGLEFDPDRFVRFHLGELIQVKRASEILAVDGRRLG